MEETKKEIYVREKEVYRTYREWWRAVNNLDGFEISQNHFIGGYMNHILYASAVYLFNKDNLISETANKRCINDTSYVPTKEHPFSRKVCARNMLLSKEPLSENDFLEYIFKYWCWIGVTSEEHSLIGKNNIYETFDEYKINCIDINGIVLIKRDTTNNKKERKVLKSEQENDIRKKNNYSLFEG